MRKRSILSLIFTIIVLVLTFNLWLEFRPLSFQMDIKSNTVNPVLIKTVLNRKNDDVFKKCYDCQAEIDLNNFSQYYVEFNKRTPPKRLRLDLNNLTPNAEYIISNISFKHGKYKISDLSVFSSDSAKITVRDDSLVIIPNSSNITINCSKRLKVFRPCKFLFEIFCIISILSFLLFYKLTSYLADFKINKNASRLDILFLLICAIIMFIPMSHINQEEISVQENRTLAKWKSLIVDNKINYNFGKDFNEWFNDRFNFREKLIYINGFIQDTFSSVYQTDLAIMDKNKKLFIYKPQLYGTYADVTNEEKENILENVIRFKNFCNQKGIKLYVFVVPQKVNVYKEDITLYKMNNEPIGLRMKPDLEEIVDYIYPLEALENEKNLKKDYLYYKLDTHMTHYGMYTAYLELIKVIKQSFDNIKPVNINEFEYTENKQMQSIDDMKAFSIGDAMRFVPNAEKYLDYKYKFYNLEDVQGLNFEYTNYDDLYLSRSSSYIKGQVPKGMIIGTSYTNQLFKFCKLNFKNLYKIQSNFLIAKGYHLMDLYPKILNIKPDIIILCFNEGDLKQYLLNFMNSADNVK